MTIFERSERLGFDSTGGLEFHEEPAIADMYLKRQLPCVMPFAHYVTDADVESVRALHGHRPANLFSLAVAQARRIAIANGSTLYSHMSKLAGSEKVLSGIPRVRQEIAVSALLCRWSQGSDIGWLYIYRGPQVGPETIGRVPACLRNVVPRILDVDAELAGRVREAAARIEGALQPLLTHENINDTVPAAATILLEVEATLVEVFQQLAPEQLEKRATTPSRLAPGQGMRWQDVQVLAEEHVQCHGNVFPGLRRLARLLGCAPSTLTEAIKHSAYLRARQAEHDRGQPHGKGRQKRVQIDDLSVDQTIDRGELAKHNALLDDATDDELTVSDVPRADHEDGTTSLQALIAEQKREQKRQMAGRV